MYILLNYRWFEDKYCIMDTDNERYLHLLEDEFKDFVSRNRVIGYRRGKAEGLSLVEAVRSQWVFLLLAGATFEFKQNTVKDALMPDVNLTSFNPGNLTLEELKIPFGCSVLDFCTFENAYYLQRVQIPSTVTYIGVCCFKSCVNLKEVSFSGDSNLRMISSAAFANCKSLQSFDLPTTVSTLDMGCFSNCEQLQKFNMPAESYLQKIGINAFSDCCSLKEFDLKSTKYLTRIAKATFDNTGVTALDCRENSDLLRYWVKMWKESISDGIDILLPRADKQGISIRISPKDYVDMGIGLISDKLEQCNIFIVTD